MPTGWQDYTYPITIAAQTIPHLNVDITAQSIDALTIRIVGQSAPIEITTPEGESLSVAITSSVALDVNITNTPVEITNPTGENLNVAVQSSVALDVNITNTPIEITNPAGENLNVAVQSSTELNVSVTNTPIEITNPTGEVLDVAVQSSTTLNVNIANAPIEITNPSGENLNVAVQSSTELNVNITNPTIEVTNPDGAPMEVSIESSVTLNVHIESATTFTVNIQTSAGANIVIDKLTTEAYKEDRRTLSNNGDTASMMAPGTTTRLGKFFPRGCRGYIHSIEVYCRNYDSSDRKLYIYVSPQPGMGRVLSYELTVPAMSDPAWRSVAVKRFWNYDSMFIWVLGSAASYPKIGYDGGQPHDGYQSTNEVSWNYAGYRYWIRVKMVGLTVGDLPVSGTVNTIEVPLTTTQKKQEGVSVPNNTAVSVVSFEGAGELVEAKFIWSSDVDPTSAITYHMYIYVDGSWVYDIFNGDLTQSATATSGRCAIGEFWKFGANKFFMTVRLPLKFKRKIELKAWQYTGSTVNVTGILLVNAK